MSDVRPPVTAIVFLAAQFLAASVPATDLRQIGDFRPDHTDDLVCPGVDHGNRAVTISVDPGLLIRTTEGHAGGSTPLMQPDDLVRVSDIPDLRRIAGDKTNVEEIRTRGAVCEQYGMGL